MKQAAKKGYRFVADIVGYFYSGWKSKLFLSYLKTFSKLFILHLNRLRHDLILKQKNLKPFNEKKFDKLRKMTIGLHSLLPADLTFTYSILLPIQHPHPSLLKKCLQSIVDQTAPYFEVLIGLEREQKPEITSLLQHFKDCYADKIKIIYIEENSSFSGLAWNHLAQQATGNFLFLIEQSDWIRPDLLFRYEQTLRFRARPQHTILYCQDTSIESYGQDIHVDYLNYLIPIESPHPSPLVFPFFFDYFSRYGLLVPTMLWNQVEGFHLSAKGAEYEDLLLRLDLAGAEFQEIPISLYFRRTEPTPRPINRESFLQALSSYTQAKHLKWEWQPGYAPFHVRAIPAIQHKHSIQVIIPFKDQKKLTLSCVHHVLKQKDVSIKITAIDNASQDPSIKEELESLGAEVLTIQEPFNYSRLNNLAVQYTQTAQDCDLLLFLNNDVDLEAEALVEMVRWIDQPQIGMVGCRLHYPDGRLQHGGIYLDYYLLPDQMHWRHIEKLRLFDEMEVSKRLGVVHAVTAACALIKRQVFLDVGGFDEVWYPIAYSDTNLVVKLGLKGLKCFYTPYATGIHHESVSRQEGIEDYENSRWLHQFFLKSRHQVEFRFFH